MNELSAVEKARALIRAYLEDKLPDDYRVAIMSVASEYIALDAALLERDLSNAAFHQCIALCRHLETNIDLLYSNYLHD